MNRPGIPSIDPKFRATRPAHLMGRNPRAWLRTAYDEGMNVKQEPGKMFAYTLAGLAIGVAIATLATLITAAL